MSTEQCRSTSSATAAAQAATRSRRRLSARTATLLMALVTAVTVAAPAPGVATAAPVDRWSSENGGPANTLHNPGETVVTAANASQVRQAWQVTGQANGFVAPTVVGGVVYSVQHSGNAYDPAVFTAASVRTGATLWTLKLPAQQSYHRGISVTGSMAVLPYDGYRKPGGVTAVNLTSRTHAWSRATPHPPAEATMSGPGGPLVAGGGRVFQLGGREAVVTYRLSDGALLWTAPRGLNSQNRPNAVSAIAAANNVIYTGGDEGIVAYDAPSGRRLWTTPTYSGISLVVAGGRVFSSASVGLAAVNAAGCGRSTCPVLWSRRFWGESPYPVQIGGVDGSTLFITYSSGSQSFLKRLSAATGAQQWSVTLANKSLQPPVRAGSTVWLRKGCVSGGVTTICLMAFPATGTSTRPLLTVALPQSRHSAVGGLAVSGGTVIDLDWPRYITGYRVPGT